MSFKVQTPAPLVVGMGFNGYVSIHRRTGPVHWPAPLLGDVNLGRFSGPQEDRPGMGVLVSERICSPLFLPLLVSLIRKMERTEASLRASGAP